MGLGRIGPVLCRQVYEPLGRGQRQESTNRSRIGQEIAMNGGMAGGGRSENDPLPDS